MKIRELWPTTRAILGILVFSSVIYGLWRMRDEVDKLPGPPAASRADSHDGIEIRDTSGKCWFFFLGDTLQGGTFRVYTAIQTSCRTDGR